MKKIIEKTLPLTKVTEKVGHCSEKIRETVAQTTGVFSEQPTQYHGSSWHCHVCGETHGQRTQAQKAGKG